MFLLIDKPQHMTSHDVVDYVRKVTGEKRVGHGGTLDPNATGLLIVGVGRESTKKLGDIAQNTKKTYDAEILLGETRDTDDAEGQVITTGASKIKEEKEVRRVVESFLGQQDQLPPSYSAIKLHGKKAYELARAGKIPELKLRTITVFDIDITSYEWPLLKVTLTVSSGTYIRSIARDIGEKLGCGAYLKNLRRTQIGDYALDRSVSLPHLNKDNWKEFSFGLQ